MVYHYSEAILVNVCDTIEEIQPECFEVPRWGRYLAWSVYVIKDTKNDKKLSAFIRVIPKSPSEVFELKADIIVDVRTRSSVEKPRYFYGKRECVFTQEKNVCKIEQKKIEHWSENLARKYYLTIQLDVGTGNAHCILPPPQPDFAEAFDGHDVKFKVKNETTLYAEKKTLIAVSRHFEKMLKTASNEISVPKENEVDIKLFLACICPNSTVLICAQNVEVLARLADKFDCNHLRRECIQAVFKYASPANVMKMYFVAATHLRSTDLIDFCVDMIVAIEWQAVLNDAYYTKLSPENRLRITEHMLCRSVGLHPQTTVNSEATPVPTIQQINK